MRKFLKHYFVPHSENNFRAHFFHEQSVALLALLIVFTFGLAVFYGIALPLSTIPAAVVPGVLVDLANSNREAQPETVPLLRTNPVLVEAARMKAQDMATKGYFAHDSPDGKSPWYWFSKAGYNFLYAGENLAVDFTESTDVNMAWMNSPGHRANILNGHFTEIGIALASGYYQGRQTTYVVQLFGQPLPTLDAGVKLSTSVASPSPPNPIPPPRPKQYVSEPKVEPLILDNELLAVKNTSVLEPVPDKVITERQEEIAGQAKYSSWFEELLVNPRKTLGFIYTLFAFLIVGALVFTLSFEISRHHFRHTLYALALLALIVILFFIFGQSIVREVLIA